MEFFGTTADEFRRKTYAHLKAMEAFALYMDESAIPHVKIFER